MVDYIIKARGVEKLLRRKYGKKYNYVIDDSRRQQSEFERSNGFFPFIPYNYADFMYVIDLAKNLIDDNPHFIDVGCGTGEKLLLAHLYCDIDKVSGVEYNNYTYAMAHKVVGRFAQDLIHDNALTIDYSPYNLIYMFHPMQNDMLQMQLFAQAAETAPNGAAIVEVYGSYYIRHMSTSAKYRHLFANEIQYNNSIYIKRNGVLYPVVTNSIW